MTIDNKEYKEKSYQKIFTVFKTDKTPICTGARGTVIDYLRNEYGIHCAFRQQMVDGVIQYRGPSFPTYIEISENLTLERQFDVIQDIFLKQDAASFSALEEPIEQIPGQIHFIELEHRIKDSNNDSWIARKPRKLFVKMKLIDPEDKKDTVTDTVDFHAIRLSKNIKMIDKLKIIDSLSYIDNEKKNRVRIQIDMPQDLWDNSTCFRLK